MDIYERVTKEIIQSIEEGANEFVMPWHNNSSLPVNPISGTIYSGINVLLLWSESKRNSFPSNCFATYKQWKEKGRQVGKGQKGISIVFYQRLIDQENETGDQQSAKPKDDQSGKKGIDTEKFETQSKPQFILKNYTVFNMSQLTEYELLPTSSSIPLLSTVETFISKTGAEILRNSSEACYLPSLDLIRMPPPEAFFCGETRTSIDSYYSVLMHELTHWTGHISRLDRNLKSRFGTENYAMEELIAELGSAFLCAHLKLNSKPRLDHAPYIQNWLRVLKNDQKAIFTASSIARLAVEFVMARDKTA